MEVVLCNQVVVDLWVQDLGEVLYHLIIVFVQHCHLIYCLGFRSPLTFQVQGYVLSQMTFDFAVVVL